ncbi:MAG: lipopolysaccharide biosynthesis protein [Lachnospiraceae bacterium]
MVKKSEFIWNVIASVCASLLSVVLLFVATRVNGVNPAGMFSIAFATATVLNSVADFGMRVYQVTDTRRQHSFSVYLSARLVVDAAMIILGIGFVLISGYSMEKAAICLGLLGFRFVDAVSETYQGEFQLNGRLDVAGKSVFYRMTGSIAVFAVIDMVTKNIIIATVAMMLTNLMGLLVYDLHKIKHYTKASFSSNKGEIGHLIKDCFPLFFSTFLNNYIINAPKYAIDKLLTYDMQTYFNIIYLPTFTINLMSIFVLKPMLRGLGEMWNEKNYRKFMGIVLKMGGAIVAMTVLVELVCYSIGIPILSFIYGVELQPFKSDLLILVLSGGFSALGVALFYALTTMRAQKCVSLAYVVAAVGGIFLPNILVGKYGITGAAISSVAITIILSGVLLFIFALEWRKKENA